MLHDTSHVVHAEDRGCFMYAIFTRGYSHDIILSIEPSEVRRCKDFILSMPRWPECKPDKIMRRIDGGITAQSSKHGTLLEMTASSPLVE